MEDVRSAGMTLGALGNTYAAQGDLEQASSHYRRGIDMAQQAGDWRSEAVSSWNLGMLLGRGGDFHAAAAFMRRAVELEQAQGHPDAHNHALALAQVETLLAAGDAV